MNDMALATALNIVLTLDILFHGLLEIALFMRMIQLLCPILIASRKYAEESLKVLTAIQVTHIELVPIKIFFILE